MFLLGWLGVLWAGSGFELAALGFGEVVVEVVDIVGFVGLPGAGVGGGDGVGDWLVAGGAGVGDVGVLVGGGEFLVGGSLVAGSADVGCVFEVDGYVYALVVWVYGGVAVFAGW